MPIPFTSPEAHPDQAERDGVWYGIWGPGHYLRATLPDGSWQQVFYRGGPRNGDAVTVFLNAGESLADRLNRVLSPLRTKEEEVAERDVP